MDKVKEKAKKKRRVNYVDIILLLVMIAVVGLIAYTYLSPLTKQLFAETYDVEYTIRIQGVRLEFNDKIHEGDTVVENETLKSIGTVKSVVYSASKFVGTDSAGKTVISEHPDMYDVTVVVGAKAEMPSGMYEVNSFAITAGKTIRFRVPDFTGEATCISISETGN